MIRARFRARFTVGAGESFIAHCRQGIRGDQLPVAGYGYTTNSKMASENYRSVGVNTSSAYT